MKPKNIYYRSYKNFDEPKFLAEIENTQFSFTADNPNQNYDLLSNKFLEIVNNHAPLKKKIIRGNQKPFMNKEFQKAVYTRSRLKNRYNKKPNKENEIAYKKQRNKCVSLRKQSIKDHIKKVTDKGINSNKDFWSFIKPFITNKRHISNNDNTIIEGNKVISDESELAKKFNEHYINIVEKTSGIKPSNLGELHNSKDHDETIDLIIKSYENHPSVDKIKNILNKETGNSIGFAFKNTNTSNVKKLLKNLDVKKAVGNDTIPPKLLKIAADSLSRPLTKAINKSIENSIFPNNAKVASVIPLDKGKPNKNEITNYRPVSILNSFSKIYEQIIKDQLVSAMEKYFSPLISAYRKNYSTQHVILRLIEEWRLNLDQNNVIGAVLTDLSKAFDCINHDLIKRSNFRGATGIYCWSHFI